jgi:hypothetical protein
MTIVALTRAVAPKRVLDAHGVDSEIDRPKPGRARYRGLDGKERSRSFLRKVEAERWLRNEMALQDRGIWTDPSAGRVLFRGVG